MSDEMQPETPEEPQEEVEVAEEAEAAAEPPSLLPLDLSGVDKTQRGSDVAESAREALVASIQRAQIALGETIDYVVNSSLMPGHDQMPVPVLGVSLFLSGFTLGQKIHGTALTDNFYGSEEQYDDFVMQVARGLVEARSQALAQQRQSVNGLVLPGSQN